MNSTQTEDDVESLKVNKLSRLNSQIWTQIRKKKSLFYSRVHYTITLHFVPKGLEGRKNHRELSRAVSAKKTLGHILECQGNAKCVYFKITIFSYIANCFFGIKHCLTH